MGIADPNIARKSSCPTCGKDTQIAWKPFCSKRCADVDLGRWLNERYVVPIDPEDDEIAPDAEE